MKGKFIIVLILLCVFSLPSYATFTYTVSSGYVEDITLENFESLLVEGGGISNYGV